MRLSERRLATPILHRAKLEVSVLQDRQSRNDHAFCICPEFHDKAT